MKTDIVAGRRPVYEGLVESLRRKIAEAKIPPGELIGSEYQLATEFGLSRHSVRKAIDCLISDGLVERRAGKGVFSRSATTSARAIRLIVGNLGWQTLAEFVSGAQQAADQRGIQVQISDARGDFDKDLALLHDLSLDSSSGAIIASLHNRHFTKALFELEAKGFPFVVTDELPEFLDVAAVSADNYAGGYRVGKEMVALGHRRIGFLGDLVAQTVRQRLNGLRDAVNDAGIPFDRALVSDLHEENDRMGDWSVRIAACARELLNRPERPTALFCSCDAVAAFVYPVLREMKISVPADLSIVGFDDATLCQWLHPPLATVRQPMREMGGVAVEMLLARLRNAEAPVQRRVLPIEWVPRASLAALLPPHSS